MSQESYRHFYLYAKNWYKKTNWKDDLKNVIAERSCVYPEHVTESDILTVLTNAVEHHVCFKRFIGNLLEKERFYPDQNLNDYLVMSMLSLLSLTNIKDINFNLGDPDPNVLPLNSKD